MMYELNKFESEREQVACLGQGYKSAVVSGVLVTRIRCGHLYYHSLGQNLLSSTPN